GAFAESQSAPSRGVLAQAADEERRLEELRRSSTGGERLAVIRQEMQETMEEGAGIYRDENGLVAAAQKIQELQDRLPKISLEDASLTFNTELTGCLELAYMLDLAEAMIHSGLERRESRGAHQRTDYPQRDDGRFLAHSLAYRVEGGSPRIEYLPVTITRWPPGERVYGR
ncbi:MAG: succinate dehydrogenase/fumarate reductase flavoprotein subunit, partial [Thermoanaerobaculia bacterium]